MSYKIYLAVLPCAAFCAGLPLTASAQEQSTGAQSGTAHAPTAQSGMVVVRDAQTGQLRAPTAAESRALSPAPSASAAMTAPARPTVVTHPGGSKQVKLGERSLVYSVVTRDADGKLHDQCVQGAAAADKALHASAPAKHNEEHRHD
jgi:hypothetical protein